MARSRFPGICYFCKNPVPAGEGHYERYRGGWRVIHARTCTFKQRAEKAKECEK